MEKKKIDVDSIEEHVTMEVIVEIAQSIDGIIKFTYDIPENYKSKKLPVLDVNISVNKKEENWLWILWEAYKKQKSNFREYRIWAGRRIKERTS